MQLEDNLNVIAQLLYTILLRIAGSIGYAFSADIFRSATQFIAVQLRNVDLDFMSRALFFSSLSHTQAEDSSLYGDSYGYAVNVGDLFFVMDCRT